MENKYKYPLYKVFTRANVDSLKENIKAWLYTYMFLHKLRNKNSEPLGALYTILLNEFSGNLKKLQLYDLDIDLHALIRDNIVLPNPTMEPQKMMQEVQDRMVVLQGEREHVINGIIKLKEKDLEKLINELFSGEPGTNSEWVKMITRSNSDAAAAAGQAAAEQAAFDMEMEGLDAELEEEKDRDAMQLYHEAAREVDDGGYQAEPLFPLMRQAEELKRAVASAGKAVTLAEEQAAASAAAASEVAASAVAASAKSAAKQAALERRSRLKSNNTGGSRRKNTHRKNKNRKKSKRTKLKR